jgi:hypothetical protein
VFENVVVQPRDAREASDVFYRQRMGDVLLTYENEVVLTNQARFRLCALLLPLDVPSPPLLLAHPILGALPSRNAHMATHTFALVRPPHKPRAQVYGGDKALPYAVPSPNVRISCPLALVRFAFLF